MEGDREGLVDVGPSRHTENYISLKLKYGLLCFSMFFWIIGGLFCAIGGYVVSQKAGFDELSDFASDPGIILGALGVFIFFVSSFGVLGSLRENICLLQSYKILLVVILVFEVCCGLIGFAFWPEIKRMVDRNLAVAIEKYNVNPDLRNMIDMLQRELECCGSLSIDDWDSNPYFTCENMESYRSCGVPWSCCLRKYENNRQCGYGVRNNRVRVKLTNEIYTVGCLDKGFEFFKQNIFMVAGLAFGCSLPLIIGMFATHVFIGQIRKLVERTSKGKVFI